MRSAVLVSSLLVVLVALVAPLAVSGTHQYVAWYSPSGWNIMYFSATFVVPTRPGAPATYYVWPGVQDGTGVLQSVLDGRKAGWWFGNGWYGSPSLPWGGGANVNNGDRIYGTLRNTGDGSPKGNWVAESGYMGGSKISTDNFALSGKSFNMGLFDVETYGVTWNFGTITIPWLEVKSNSPKTGWCSKTLATGGSIGYSVGSVSVYTCGAYCSGCLYKDIKIWSTATASHAPALEALLAAGNFSSLSEPLPAPIFPPQPAEGAEELPVIDEKDLPPHPF